MSDEQATLSGPDLAKGVELSSLADGAMLLGHAQGEPVLLARRGKEFFAIGAVCTHYGGPLEQGVMAGDAVRCPWHHAEFSLRTGAPLRAPALDGVGSWRLEQKDGRVYVRDKVAAPAGKPTAVASHPTSVVIVGGGAAGNAAAETLRREGYAGPVTVLSADAALPCDRPNLSKGYLAGTAPQEWTVLRSPEFYREQNIELKLNTRVMAIDAKARQVQLADGSHLGYGALLLATGADPIHLPIPGADLPHVHYLRTAADSQALVDAASKAKHAVVIGASFIGLEVASSLRARNVEVQVVGRETVLMEKVLGPQMGAFIRKLHEEHDVTFHLGTSASRIDAQGVTLESGEQLAADLVVIGIGVRPQLALAEQAGLTLDRGVVVNEYLETSVPGIFAAGDIARWPDPLTGESIRVEHWVVAGRQGQAAARNMLGLRERYEAVPFFWTEQYDFGVAYVGHAPSWDEAVVEGQIDARDCQITYRRAGKKLAVAVVHRDLDGLHAEVEFERAIAAKSGGAAG